MSYQSISRDIKIKLLRSGISGTKLRGNNSRDGHCKIIIIMHEIVLSLRDASGKASASNDISLSRHALDLVPEFDPGKGERE